MAIPMPWRIILALLAITALLAAHGCAGGKQAGARYLQRGEAHKLLAEQAARAEPDPDPDKLPLKQDYLEIQGDLLAAQGQAWNALRDYRQALAQAKAKGKPHLRLQGKIASLYLRLGSFSQAKTMFQALCGQEPKNGVYWQGLGLAHLALKEHKAAEEALRQSVAHDPSLWRAQNTLGILYNQRRKPRRAMAAFRAALVTAPDRPALHNNLGLAYVLDGSGQQAEASFRRALALDPEHRRAANNLGLLLAAGGRDQESLQVFSRVLGQAKAHNNLGCVQAWQGDPQPARRQFLLALNTMPRYYFKAKQHLEQMSRPAPRRARASYPALAGPSPPAKARRLRPLSPNSPSRPPGVPAGLARRTVKPAGQKALKKIVARPQPQATAGKVFSPTRVRAASQKTTAALPRAAKHKVSLKPSAATVLSASAGPGEAQGRLRPAAAGLAEGLWLGPDGKFHRGPARPGGLNYGIVIGRPD
jgi:Tfp pilus assembly protein PilF